MSDQITLLGVPQRSTNNIPQRSQESDSRFTFLFEQCDLTDTIRRPLRTKLNPQRSHKFKNWDKRSHRNIYTVGKHLTRCKSSVHVVLKKYVLAQLKKAMVCLCVMMLFLHIIPSTLQLLLGTYESDTCSRQVHENIAPPLTCPKNGNFKSF
uniref:Transmembrane protein n=1 Tax=Steinernema glaseri TaxID=37863 RepID=A0A1I7YF03_9BILA